MQIGILSRNEKLYSTRRLIESANQKGHETQIIDPLCCYLDITSQRPMIYHKQKKLDDFTAIIPRIGTSVTFYGTAVLRQFEMMGVYTVNESVAIGRSRDKLRSLQLLSRKGIGLPTTSFAYSTEMTALLIEIVGRAPLVIKLLEGTQGKGVVLAETAKAAESVIDAFREIDAHILVQEFINEASGCDIRCFVIGDEVVATMLRKAKTGEFRSNLHQGGACESVTISVEERQTAIHAAKVMGLNIAGVDIIRSKRGPLVLEVNSSPGLEGIEKASQVDVAGKIIEFIEKNHSGS